MKQKLNRIATSAGWFAAALLLATLNAQYSTLLAQGTSFSYQGRLTDNGSPANGNYDLRFNALDAATAGNQAGSPSTLLAVAVSNGLFTVTLDFGAGVFTGPARWLEIGARTNGSGSNSFTILSPRQPLTPVPYAIYAAAAATTTNVGAGVVVKSLNGLTDAVTLSPGPNVTLTTNGNRLTVSSTGGAGVFSLNGTNAFYNAGFVGIGTNNPDYALTVRTPSLTRDVMSWRNPAGELGRLGWSGATTDGWLGLHSGSSWNVQVAANGVTYFNGGKVGIGTAAPQRALQVGDSGTVGSEGMIHLASRSSSGVANLRDWELGVPQTGDVLTGEGYSFVIRDTTASASARFFIQWGSGNVGIGTAYPQAKLDVAGETRTCVLTITGGCDLAEPFEMSDRSIPSGALVAIDEEHPGRLKMSTRAYDSRAAGIISGANGIKPGISLHQEGILEGGQNVALTGRVYALADASNGSIKPGDLLTTSDTPGHCMKVTDHSKAQGAIVGKAMTMLDQGRGYVLVLVTLQ